MKKIRIILIPVAGIVIALTATYLFLDNKHTAMVRNEIDSENRRKAALDSLSQETLRHANALADSGMADSAIALLGKTYTMLHDSGYTSLYRDSMYALYSVLYGDNEKYKSFVTSGLYKEELMRLGGHNLELLYQNKFDYRLCTTPVMNAKVNKILYDNRNNIHEFRKVKSDRIQLGKVIGAAALSSLMGYDKLFSYHSSYSEKLDSVFVYRSPMHQNELYHCRVNGGRIIWGIKKAEGDDRETLFFTDNNKINYSVNGDVVTIHVVRSGGSEIENTYSIKKLKRLVPIH